MVAFNPIKCHVIQEAESGKSSNSKIVGFLKVTIEAEEATRNTSLSKRKEIY